MYLSGQSPKPGTIAKAMAEAGLAHLASANASLTTAEQADCLRALERMGSRHTAARASLLSAFAGTGGHEDDGHGSAKAWLKWQTRITSGAAGGALGWMRRLATHAAMRDALAAGDVSESWARQVCAWTDLLRANRRDDADRILLGAAAGGADLRDLAGLAEEMRNRCAGPDADGDDGFEDRGLRLGTTFRGAGKLDGDLTPGCAAALGAVVEALGKKAGPEDTRTRRQRHHDALEEACRRLIAAGSLPDRAGQPTQIMLHMSLDQLRGLPGAAQAEAAWPGPVAGPGADCDATIVPVVTGRVDPLVLDWLAAALLRGTPVAAGQGGTAGQDKADAARQDRAARAARRIVIAAAADLLSGPGRLASWLRTGLAPGPAATPSLPLDTGTATETIPAHLRRAVTVRRPGPGGGRAEPGPGPGQRGPVHERPGRPAADGAGNRRRHDPAAPVPRHRGGVGRVAGRCEPSGPGQRRRLRQRPCEYTAASQ
jgi:hypothetical protein